MSRPHPRARLFEEEGGLVTGCDDVAVAREVILAEYLLTMFGIRPDEDPVALSVSDNEADWHRAVYVAESRAAIVDDFPPEDAEIERGRFVPHRYGDAPGWVWRKASKPGRGVTTAVVWD